MLLKLLFRLFITVFVYGFYGCDGAKILFSAAVDTGTHIGSMTPLIMKAASEGHEVTVFETSSLKRARNLGPNVTVVFIQVLQDKNMSGHFANLIFRKEIKADTLYTPFAIDDSKTQQFLKNKENSTTIRNLLNTDWDLVIIDEIFGVHSFAIAAHLKHFRKIPYIIYSTTAMLHTTIHTLGLGRNYVSEPYLLTAVPKNDSDIYSPSLLANRWDNIYNILMDLYYVNYYAIKHHMTSVEKLAIPQNWHQIFSESSWIFADYTTRLRLALTEGTDIRQIGAVCRTAAPFLGEFEEFVSDPTSKGTIYIAFGSYINWMHAPQALIDTYFDAIDALDDYRVIFSYNGAPPRRPVRAHVKLTKWAPQLEIFAHPKTRIFLSHGGLKSWKEALCNALPVVYMPVFAEQSYNAKLALRMGYASVLNKFTVDRRQLVDSLKRVLNEHSTFKANALKARRMYLDRPIGALDEAMFAIGRILKNPQRKRHFPRRNIDQSTFDVLYVPNIVIIVFLIWYLC